MKEERNPQARGLSPGIRVPPFVCRVRCSYDRTGGLTFTIVARILHLRSGVAVSADEPLDRFKVFSSKEEPEENRPIQHEED